MSIYYNDSHAYDPTAGQALGKISRDRRRKALKRLRDMTWEDYGISKYRYQELKAFCLQYPEKKEKIKYGLSSVNYAGTSGAGIGRPTENRAVANARYIKDCEMIEQAAIAAAPEIYQYIIKSVTENLPYEFIECDNELGRIPVGRTEFYGIRRLFYDYLNKKKLGTN